jgi:uncharacterized protein
MPKRVTTGAERRRTASGKVQASTKGKLSKLTNSLSAKTSARGVKRSPRGASLELTRQPIDFNPAALKFVLTPPATPPHHEPPAYEFLGELPESYGTKKLFLVARDPYCLYAYWDLTDAQYMEASYAAHDGKVFLEAFRDGTPDRIAQVQIPRGTRSWYFAAGQPNAVYFVRLGYYRHDGGFEVISRSGKAYAPRDNFSTRTQARYATIPFHLSFRELMDLVRPHLKSGEDLADALSRLQMEGYAFPFTVLPSPHTSPTGKGAPESFLEEIGQDHVRRIKLGSEEIIEIVRGRLHQLVSSGQWNSSYSSPMGSSYGLGKSRDFYMHINAELIIYGGTDPRAAVSVNGQPIKLREDGTFSYHFTFPDGRFFIPVEATAPDGLEKRSAMLSFLRLSDTVGGVAATAQEPRPEPIGRA